MCFSQIELFLNLVFTFQIRFLNFAIALRRQNTQTSTPEPQPIYNIEFIRRNQPRTWDALHCLRCSRLSGNSLTPRKKENTWRFWNRNISITAYNNFINLNCLLLVWIKRVELLAPLALLPIRETTFFVSFRLVAHSLPDRLTLSAEAQAPIRGIREERASGNQLFRRAFYPRFRWLSRASVRWTECSRRVTMRTDD